MRLNVSVSGPRYNPPLCPPGSLRRGGTPRSRVVANHAENRTQIHNANTQRGATDHTQRKNTT
eukprot:5962210-Pyramimonas_sp.AAC.1